MFLKSNFGPVAVLSSKIPRVFTYENIYDTLNEMKQPGYFNDMRIVLKPNSRIMVIASDYHADIWVLGLVNERICVYEDDMRTPRLNAIIPKNVVTQAEQNKKTVKAGQKKGKAA